MYIDLCSISLCVIVASSCAVFCWILTLPHSYEDKFLPGESYLWPVRLILVAINEGVSSVKLHNGIHHTPWVLVCQDAQAIRGLRAFPRRGNKNDVLSQCHQRQCFSMQSEHEKQPLPPKKKAEMLKAICVNVQERARILSEGFNPGWIFIAVHFRQGSALGKNRKSDVRTP